MSRLPLILNLFAFALSVLVLAAELYALSTHHELDAGYRTSTPLTCCSAPFTDCVRIDAGGALLPSSEIDAHAQIDNMLFQELERCSHTLLSCTGQLRRGQEL